MNHEPITPVVFRELEAEPYCYRLKVYRRATRAHTLARLESTQ